MEEKELTEIEQLNRQKTRNLILIISFITFALLVVLIFVAVSMAKTNGTFYAYSEMAENSAAVATGTEGSYRLDESDAEQVFTDSQYEDEYYQSSDDNWWSFDGDYEGETTDAGIFRDNHVYDDDPFSSDAEETFSNHYADDGDDGFWDDDYEDEQAFGDEEESNRPAYNPDDFRFDSDEGYFTQVSDSYFSDALFIGDSRMYGFAAWSGLPATFYSAVGFQLYKYEEFPLVQTENGKLPIFDAIPYDTFTKIYIKVGLNEMGWGNDGQFKEVYAEFIAKLRETQPRAIIYIHGLLPVTYEQDSLGDAHNNVNIGNRNIELRELAQEQGAFYLDLWSVYVNENGYLPTEKSSDGIHLRANYIGEWKDYIMSHAVID